MANEVTVTVIGNLTADPEYKQINGKDVANFSIAHTSRTFDRNTNEWKDSEPTFFNSSAWRDLAVNMKQSGYAKGTRVIAVGTLSTTKKDDRTFVNLTVTEIGPSSRFAAIPTIQKATRGGSNNGGGQSTDGWGGGNSGSSDAFGSGGSSSGSDDSPF